jgi:hypothetical protein
VRVDHGLAFDDLGETPLEGLDASGRLYRLRS